MSAADRQPCECSEQGEMSRAGWMGCHKFPIGSDKIFLVVSHSSGLLQFSRPGINILGLVLGASSIKKGAGSAPLKLCCFVEECLELRLQIIPHRRCNKD